VADRFVLRTSRRTGGGLGASPNRLIPDRLGPSQVLHFHCRILAETPTLRDKPAQTIRNIVHGRPARQPARRAAVEKLRESEPLFAATAGAAYGEKVAAAGAATLQARSESRPRSACDSLLLIDSGRGNLFVALMRRYGITPYRYLRSTAHHR